MVKLIVVGCALATFFIVAHVVNKIIRNRQLNSKAIDLDLTYFFDRQKK